MIESVFPIPVWKTKITREDYNKDLVLNQMLKNFDIDPQRNTWDNVMETSTKSNWHHSNNDEDRDGIIFESISYEESGLYKCMDNKIREFISTLNLQKNISYSWQVTNYTVSDEGYFLTSHDHGSDSFSSVLYLQFDPKNHPPTAFSNPFSAPHLARWLQKDLYNAIDKTNPFFGYLHDTWTINTEEDDYVIFPGHVKHEVPNVGKSDKKRVTISCNIKILNNDKKS
jgi:hypothetical protein